MGRNYTSLPGHFEMPKPPLMLCTMTIPTLTLVSILSEWKVSIVVAMETCCTNKCRPDKLGKYFFILKSSYFAVEDTPGMISLRSSLNIIVIECTRLVCLTVATVQYYTVMFDK